MDAIAASKSAPSTATLHSSEADLSGRGFWISVRWVAQVHHVTPIILTGRRHTPQILFSRLPLLLEILTPNLETPIAELTPWIPQSGRMFDVRTLPTFILI